MRVALLTAALAFACSAVSAQTGCHSAIILKPSPFMGTENEVISLSDGSVWQDISYKYLYLYAYYPQVVICPARGRLIFNPEEQEPIVFTVMRLR